MVNAVIGFFFFNDTATTEIYTLSLHDALPISPSDSVPSGAVPPRVLRRPLTSLAMSTVLLTRKMPPSPDRKSTRLNSSHANISYAVFCLKKKKKSPSSLSPPHPFQLHPAFPLP